MPNSSKNSSLGNLSSDKFAGNTYRNNNNINTTWSDKPGDHVPNVVLHYRPNQGNAVEGVTYMDMVFGEQGNPLLIAEDTVQHEALNLCKKKKTQPPAKANGSGIDCAKGNTDKITQACVNITAAPVFISTSKHHGEPSMVTKKTMKAKVTTQFNVDASALAKSGGLSSSPPGGVVSNLAIGNTAPMVSSGSNTNAALVKPADKKKKKKTTVAPSVSGTNGVASAAAVPETQPVPMSIHCVLSTLYNASNIVGPYMNAPCLTKHDLARLTYAKYLLDSLKNNSCVYGEVGRLLSTLTKLFTLPVVELAGTLSVLGNNNNNNNDKSASRGSTTSQPAAASSILLPTTNAFLRSNGNNSIMLAPSTTSPPPAWVQNGSSVPLGPLNMFRLWPGMAQASRAHSLYLNALASLSPLNASGSANRVPSIPPSGNAAWRMPNFQPKP